MSLVSAPVLLLGEFRLAGLPLPRLHFNSLCPPYLSRLVAITPAAGFVGTPAAALIGLVAGACSNLATRLKVSMRVDDPMDVFAVHALAGAIGTFMTGM